MEHLNSISSQTQIPRSLTPEIAKKQLETINNIAKNNPSILKNETICADIDRYLSILHEEPKGLIPALKARWEALQSQKKVQNVSLLLKQTLQKPAAVTIKVVPDTLAKPLPNPLILRDAKNEIRAGGSISIRIGTLVEGGMDPQKVQEMKESPDLALDSPLVTITPNGDLSVKLPASFSDEYRRNLQVALGVNINPISYRFPKNNKYYSGEFIIPQSQIKDFLESKLQLDPEIFLNLKVVNPQIKNSNQQFSNQQVTQLNMKGPVSPTDPIAITDCITNIDEVKAQQLVKKGEIGDFILVKSGQNTFKLIVKKHPEDIVHNSTTNDGVCVKEFSLNDVKTFMEMVLKLDASTWSTQKESRDLTKFFVLRTPISPGNAEMNIKTGIQLNYHQRVELLKAMGFFVTSHIEYAGKFIMATNGRGFDFDEMFAFVDTIKDPKVQRECLDNLIKIQAKAFGHALGVSTKVRMGPEPDGELIPTEGSWGDASMAFISETNTRYMPGIKSFNEEQKSKLMEMSVKSVEYSQMLSHAKSLKRAENALEDIKRGVPVSFSTGWHRHAVNITISGDLLIYTNRQEGGNVKTRVYKIKKTPITGERIERLMSTFHANTEEQKLSEMTYKESVKAKKNTMVKDWDLELIAELPKSAQKMGNCSFANNKAGIQAGAFILAYEESKKLSPKANEKDHIGFATQKSFELFKTIEQRDRAHKFDQWCALAPRVQSGACSITPKSHFNALRVMSTKLGLGKKSSPIQLHTSLNTLLQNCGYKLDDCASLDAGGADAENFAKNMQQGGFIIFYSTSLWDTHRNFVGNNLTIFIKTGPHPTEYRRVCLVKNDDGSYSSLVTGEGGKVVDRNLKKDTIYRTLSDLIKDNPDMKIPVDLPHEATRYGQTKLSY